MAQMNLVGSYVYNGATLGPGNNVTVPDDPALLSRIREREQRATARRDQQLAATAMLLPSGHPYKEIFPANNSQPPQYEGDASPVALTERAMRTPPAGFNINDPDHVADVVGSLRRLGFSDESLAALASGGGAVAPNPVDAIPIVPVDPNAQAPQTSNVDSTSTSTGDSSTDATGSTSGASTADTPDAGSGGATTTTTTSGSQANGPRRSSGSSSSSSGSGGSSSS